MDFGSYKIRPMTVKLDVCRASNRFKYRSGSGSANFIFTGLIQIHRFIKVAVQFHQCQIFAVRVRFRLRNNSNMKLILFLKKHVLNI